LYWAAATPRRSDDIAMGILADIQSYDDIETVIRAFYSRLLPDPIIGFFFTDIARIDLQKHIPKIAHFWEFQLFGVRNYRGNVYEVHRELHLKAAMTADHFHRWVFMLHQSVDDLFVGPNAELMKARSTMIADKMAMALASNAPAIEWMPGVQIAEPGGEKASE
jgi:hemoglobin